MSPNELLHEKREDILRVASKWGASNVRVFDNKFVDSHRAHIFLQLL